MKCIVYKAGYKYQLQEPCRITLDLRPPAPVHTDWIDFDGDGTLTLRKGYAWDGPSGPTVDTPAFMRGSLVHDALYQLMREGHLDPAVCRAPADALLRALCLEDGMSAPRAWWVHLGVRWFADPAADPAQDRPPRRAPRGCTG